MPHILILIIYDGVSHDEKTLSTVYVKVITIFSNSPLPKRPKKSFLSSWVVTKVYIYDFLTQMSNKIFKSS